MRKILLCFVFLLFHNFHICIAQAATELNIQDLLIKNYNVLYNKEINNMPSLIDYSIEILKIMPDSMASYYAVGWTAVTADYLDNSAIKSKFKNLYDKFYPTINDLNSDTVEKLILSEALFSGFSVNEMTEEELNNSHQIGQNSLQFFKNNCPNQDYSALAILFLTTKLSRKESAELCGEFIEKYPRHKAIPLVNFKMIMDKYLYSTNHDYFKFIEEMKKLAEKYKDVDSPFGNYKISTDAFASIIKAYVELNNFEKAKEQLEIIKREAPDYFRIRLLEYEIEIYAQNKNIKIK